MLQMMNHLLLAACCCLVGGAASPATDEEKPTWSDVVERHLKEKPDATAQDVYKLMYQGILGPGHMVSSEQAALKYIREEIEALTPIEFAELAFEPISPDGTMLRVNLRPFIAEGGDPAKLARAFYLTAKEIDADKRRGKFTLLWTELSRKLAEDGKLNTEAANSVTALASEHGWAAMHHSNKYREAYRPAYRVVLLDILKQEQPALFSAKTD